MKTPGMAAMTLIAMLALIRPAHALDASREQMAIITSELRSVGASTQGVENLSPANLAELEAILGVTGEGTDRLGQITGMSELERKRRAEDFIQSHQ